MNDDLMLGPQGMTAPAVDPMQVLQNIADMLASIGVFPMGMPSEVGMAPPMGDDFDYEMVLRQLGM